MDLTVLIPTYQRPQELHRCLDALSALKTTVSFEVLVGIDGGKHESANVEVPERIRDRTRVVEFEKIGCVMVRRELLAIAQGRVILWYNDDSCAQPGLLETHLAIHDHTTPRIVIGKAFWRPVEQPTLFDRLVQDSDLVFFRQPATTEPVQIGYRDCYGLNMSFPLDAAMQSGGVPELQNVYGYEDVEIAYRMQQAGVELWYAPDAKVMHDHRYLPLDVHRREYLLGRSAWAFTQVNPEFACELFRCDLRDSSVTERFLGMIEQQWHDALRIEKSFLSLDQISPDAVDESILPILAEHWVLLKRLLWRWGVLDAQRGIPSRWSRISETSPESVLCASPDPV